MIRLVRRYGSPQASDITISDLIEHACQSAAYYADGGRECQSLAHARLVSIVGNLIEHLLSTGSLTPAQLPDLVGSLGDWKIDTEAPQ